MAVVKKTSIERTSKRTRRGGIRQHAGSACVLRSAALCFADQPPSSPRRERAVHSLPMLCSRRRRTADAALIHRSSLSLFLSLAPSSSLSDGVSCCCQPHGRTRLAVVRLQLIPAVAAAGRFLLAELLIGKTFGEGTRWDTGRGNDSVRV